MFLTPTIVPQIFRKRNPALHFCAVCIRFFSENGALFRPNGRVVRPRPCSSAVSSEEHCRLCRRCTGYIKWFLKWNCSNRMVTSVICFHPSSAPPARALKRLRFRCSKYTENRPANPFADRTNLTSRFCVKKQEFLGRPRFAIHISQNHRLTLVHCSLILLLRNKTRKEEPFHGKDHPPRRRRSVYLKR